MADQPLHPTGRRDPYTAMLLQQSREAVERSRRLLEDTKNLVQPLRISVDDDAQPAEDGRPHSSRPSAPV